MTNFKGQTAFIFGASGGIGSKIAEKISQLGADTVLFGHRAGPLRKAVKQCRLLPKLTFAGDIRRKDKIFRQINEAIRLVKRIDILFYCIGIGTKEFLEEHSIEAWEKTIDVNLNGAFYVIKAVLPSMISNKYGRIILISSRLGKMAMPGVAAYCVSKHGLIGLAKSAALELAKYNITVNCVCPGRVNTPMTAKTIKELAKKFHRSEKSMLKQFSRENAQQRLIEPEEVTDLSIFLATKESASINGEALGITGGLSYYPS